MKFSAPYLKWFKPFIILLISAHLYSCSSWYVLKEPYAKQINDKKPKLVKVELYDGERMEICNPSIEGDTLTGIILVKKEKRTSLESYYQEDTLTIALHNFNQIKMKKIDSVGPFFATLVICGGFAGIVYLFVKDYAEQKIWE